jgi:hypothetical protein
MHAESRPTQNDRKFVIDPLDDCYSKQVSVTVTPQTLSELLGVALPEGTVAADLLLNTTVGDEVHYNPVGTATTDNALLRLPLYRITGVSTLSTATFRAATGTVSMGVVLKQLNYIR